MRPDATLPSTVPSQASSIEPEVDEKRLLECLSFLSVTLTSPSITIVIPVYNHYRYLEECLLSLGNQTHRDFEVICIDDASSDQRVTKLMHALQNKLAGLRII